MRPFGHAEDLDLDFGQADRQSLITTLLAHCDEPRDAAFWWSQTVGARIAALLQLVALTERRESLALSARCARTACGATFEFELPLPPLIASAGDVGTFELQLGERKLRLRRPIGQDLRQWRQAQPASRAAAVRLMLDTLLVEGTVHLEEAAPVAERITAADPLVDFAASGPCPLCGVTSEVPIDLETLALQRCHAQQRALLREVHCLARHYGWTEPEVLAVPPARRAQYLALLEEQR